MFKFHIGCGVVFHTSFTHSLTWIFSVSQHITEHECCMNNCCTVQWHGESVFSQTHLPWICKAQKSTRTDLLSPLRPLNWRQQPPILLRLQRELSRMSPLGWRCHTQILRHRTNPRLVKGSDNSSQHHRDLEASRESAVRSYQRLESLERIFQKEAPTLSGGSSTQAHQGRRAPAWPVQRGINKVSVWNHVSEAMMETWHQHALPAWPFCSKGLAVGVLLWFLFCYD